MKKKIFFLILILTLSLSIVALGNNIDRSIKKIPERAVLL